MLAFGMRCLNDSKESLNLKPHQGSHIYLPFQWNIDYLVRCNKIHRNLYFGQPEMVPQEAVDSLNALCDLYLIMQ